MALTRVTNNGLDPNDEFSFNGLNVTGVVTATSGVGTIILDPAGNMLKLGNATMHRDSTTGDTIIMNNTGAYNPLRASKYLINTNTVIDSSRNINAGVLTATTLYGNGSNLTGISAGYWVAGGSGIHTTSSVGIGTNNPSQLLHLAADSAHSILLKRSGAAPSECKFSNSGNLLTISNNVNGIHFDVGSSSLETAMYIEDGGFVAIGTNNPQRRLDVLETASQTVAQIRTAGQTKALTRYQCLGDNPVFVGAARSDFNIEMNGNNVMTINHTNNNVEISGNLKVASGKGIDFSATSALAGMQSEILDDYEEGTFTPTILQGYTGVSHGTGYPVGDYVKVGQLCHISLSFYFSSTGYQSTTRIRIGGLPFAGNSTSISFAGQLSYGFGNISLDKYDSLHWYIPNNQTYAEQYVMNGPTGYNVYPNANATDDWIQISGTYRVD